MAKIKQETPDECEMSQNADDTTSMVHQETAFNIDDELIKIEETTIQPLLSTDHFVNTVQCTFNKMFNMCAQRLLYETQSTNSNQSIQATQEIGDIVIKTNNDPGTSKTRSTVPVRVDNKVAERSRLYRERHREKINQRRRNIRQRKKTSQQIQTLTDLQKINKIEPITDVASNYQLSSKSHTQRQQRYYERHKEELNKRKRDSRLHLKISQSMPAIDMRRDSRLCQQN